MSDSFAIEEWKPRRKGSVYGFVTVTLNGLRIIDICIMASKKGDLFASMPKRTWTNNAGKTIYSPIVEFADKMQGYRFSDALIAHLRSMDAGAFAGAPSPRQSGDGTVTELWPRRTAG